MHAKGLIILLLTITVITGLVLYWYNLQLDYSVPSLNMPHHEKTTSLGGTIYTQGSNPVANSVPDTNPIKTSVSNPFDGYQNPFDAK
jgi:hypothetical protein